MRNSTEDSGQTSGLSLDELRHEERRLFKWLAGLHERLSLSPTYTGLKVLEIARARWLKAREDLDPNGAND